jgi:hypothetical protein
MKFNFARTTSYDPIKNESHTLSIFSVFVNSAKEYTTAIRLMKSAIAGIEKMLEDCAKDKKQPLNRFQMRDIIDLKEPVVKVEPKPLIPEKVEEVAIKQQLSDEQKTQTDLEKRRAEKAARKAALEAKKLVK